MKQPFGNILASMILAAGLSVAGVVGPLSANAAKSGNPESVEYYEDAVTFLKKGDVNAAVIQLKNSLQKDPNNTDARRLLGDIYLRIGNAAAAEKEFKAALRRATGADKSLMIKIARAYLMQGKYKAVLKELTDDTSTPGIRTRVLLARGHAHLGLGKLENASKAFAEAERLTPGDVGAKVATARVLINRRKLKSAEAKIDEALALKPDTIDARVLKGEIKRLGGEMDAAVASFDRALKLNPYNMAGLLGRAATLITMKRETDAEADLQVVFKRVPRHPLASHLLALIRFRGKDYTGAMEALQQAGSALDNHLPSIFLKGAASYATDQFEQAEKSLMRYISEAPDNARVRTLLGATMLRNNQPERSVEMLMPLVGTKNETPQVLALMGSAHMRLGKFTESSDYFQRAARLAPKTAAILTQLAVSRLAQGSTDKAIDSLETAIELDPESHQASILLSLMHLRQGKFDKALEVARKLGEKMPENPLPKNLLGAAYLGKNQLAEARESFNAALKINPRFHPARMNLGRLELREKKISSARSQFEKILTENKDHAGAMLALAAIAARENRSDDVVSWLRKAASANPKDITAPTRLIRFYQARRQMDKALAFARELGTRFPTNPKVIETLGAAELIAGENLDAVTNFRRLVALAPKSPRAHLLLARALSATRDISGARGSIRDALKADSAHVPAYVALGRLELRAGNEPEALKIAETLSTRFPNLAAGRMLAGDIFIGVKKYAEALAAYQAAVAKDDSAASVLRRYVARGRLGQTDVGLAEMQGWVDRKNDRRVRHILATSYIGAKRNDDALRETNRLVKAEPNNAIVLNNLAWLLDQKGDPRAIEVAERALKRAPNAAAIKDTLGWILANRGQAERGVKLLQQAYEAAPKLGDIGYHYAATLNKRGRADEARRVLRKILAAKVKFPESENAQKLLDEIGG